MSGARGGMEGGTITQTIAELAAFWGARLDEVAAAAHAATPGPWVDRNLGRHDMHRASVFSGHPDYQAQWAP